MQTESYDSDGRGASLTARPVPWGTSPAADVRAVMRHVLRYERDPQRRALSHHPHCATAALAVAAGMGRQMRDVVHWMLAVAANVDGVDLRQLRSRSKRKRAAAPAQAHDGVCSPPATSAVLGLADINSNIPHSARVATDEAAVVDPTTQQILVKADSEGHPGALQYGNSQAPVIRHEPTPHDTHNSCNGHQQLSSQHHSGNGHIMLTDKPIVAEVVLASDQMSCDSDNSTLTAHLPEIGKVVKVIPAVKTVTGNGLHGDCVGAMAGTIAVGRGNGDLPHSPEHVSHLSAQCNGNGNGEHVGNGFETTSVVQGIRSQTTCADAAAPDRSGTSQVANGNEVCESSTIEQLAFVNPFAAMQHQYAAQHLHHQQHPSRTTHSHVGSDADARMLHGHHQHQHPMTLDGSTLVDITGAMNGDCSFQGGNAELSGRDAWMDFLDPDLPRKSSSGSMDSDEIEDYGFEETEEGEGFSCATEDGGEGGYSAEEVERWVLCPLAEAAAAGDQYMVELLLEVHDANPSAYGGLPERMARLNGQNMTAKIIYEKTLARAAARGQQVPAPQRHVDAPAASDVLTGGGGEPAKREYQYVTFSDWLRSQSLSWPAGLWQWWRGGQGPDEAATDNGVIVYRSRTGDDALGRRRALKVTRVGLAVASVAAAGFLMYSCMSPYMSLKASHRCTTSEGHGARSIASSSGASNATSGHYQH